MWSALCKPHDDSEHTLRKTCSTEYLHQYCSLDAEPSGTSGNDDSWGLVSWTCQMGSTQVLHRAYLPHRNARIIFGIQLVINQVRGTHSRYHHGNW
jgi:hypothetical protein